MHNVDYSRQKSERMKRKRRNRFRGLGGRDRYHVKPCVSGATGGSFHDSGFLFGWVVSRLLCV